LTLQYAAVMENPGHTQWEQPWLKIEVLDQLGNPINTCAQVNEYVTGGSVGWQNINWNGAPVSVKPWTVTYVPLYLYKGQCVTVRFTVVDCTKGGHFGY